MRVPPNHPNSDHFRFETHGAMGITHDLLVNPLIYCIQTLWVGVFQQPKVDQSTFECLCLCHSQNS